MKYNIFLALVLFFVFAFSIKLNIFAQNNEELSPEEWQRQMDSLTIVKNDLERELNLSIKEADSLNKVITEKETEFEKKLDLLYLSVDATKSEVDDFRKTFESAEKMVNSKSGTKEEIIKKVEEVKSSKIKCLPEFWDRYLYMKKRTAVWDN